MFVSYKYARMRGARLRGEGTTVYHCVSRIIGREWLLGDREKAYFIKLMRKHAVFSGSKILTFCIMSNHFHILIEVPTHDPVVDEVFATRLRAVYSDIAVENFMMSVSEIRISRGDVEAEKYKEEKYGYRMENISEYMKSVKGQFSRWYNKSRKRKGTIWDDRFTSVVAETGETAKTQAAYIDLNPIRADIKSDPKDYRWSGYGQACAGVKEAREGIVGLFAGDPGPAMTEAEYLARYRTHMYLEAESTEVVGTPREPGTRKGISREEVKKVLEAGGKLKMHQFLRCRVRYFTDGVVMGTAAFVEEHFKRHRHCFGAKRTTGARPIRQAETDLTTIRDLRLDPIIV